ncbi:MAG: hypothetical protein JST83_10035 [Bacteroidetes bacterium]|nr:hypothetical protein [Bacteroidota bacterium]
MLMPGRQFGSGYRFGFNGKENDNDFKGEGNSLDFGARIYDPRIGKFFSLDPESKKYMFLSPYNFAANSPIWLIDYQGKGPVIAYNLLQRLWNIFCNQDYLNRANDFAVSHHLDEKAITEYSYLNKQFAIVLYTLGNYEFKAVFRQSKKNAPMKTMLDPRYNDDRGLDVDNYYDNEGRPIPTEEDESNGVVNFDLPESAAVTTTANEIKLIRLGAKASKTNTVYTFMTNVPRLGRYFGISVDFARRMKQHGARIIGVPQELIRNVPTRRLARGIEQLFIENGRKTGEITEQINSVSPKNPNYAETLTESIEWLKKNYGDSFDFLYKDRKK